MEKYKEYYAVEEITARINEIGQEMVALCKRSDLLAPNGDLNRKGLKKQEKLGIEYHQLANQRSRLLDPSFRVDGYSGRQTNKRR